MRGDVAAGLAGAGVALAALAVVYGAAAATTGAYALVVAPLLGLPIALGVFRALRRVCTTGAAAAEGLALAGILLLGVLAIMGVSFGGFPLLTTAILLALAAALTPRPRA